MGTSSAFARTMWVPGVSGLFYVKTGRLGVRSASTELVTRILQLRIRSSSSTKSLSVFVPRLESRTGRSLEENNQGCLANGANSSASWVRCPQLRFLSSKSGRKRASRGMKEKKCTESDGLSLLANDVGEIPAAVEAEPYHDSHGSIHLILGPMFAGKSTALLKRAREEASAGRRVALVKSDKDSRYGLSAVVTHDGLQMPCFAVPDLATFKAQVGERLYKEFDVIGIDEAQFFTDLYEFCLNAADYEGKTVIAAGLDGDFLRRKFGSTVDLVRVADSVVKLSSRCEICGRPAIFSFRKTLDIKTEIIGGADVYMPVCRQHFVGGQMVVGSAVTVLEAHQAVQ